MDFCDACYSRRPNFFNLLVIAARKWNGCTINATPERIATKVQVSKYEATNVNTWWHHIIDASERPAPESASPLRAIVYIDKTIDNVRETNKRRHRTSNNDIHTKSNNRGRKEGTRYTSANASRIAVARKRVP